MKVKNKMINWITNSKMKDMLYTFFSKELHSDVKEVINILPIKEDCISENYTIYLLNNENLKMYSRIYFDEPSQELIDKLTSKQKIILNCIYTRHHNGYLRQQKVEKLIDSNEYFVTPFLIQLIGEPIFEILVPINDSVDKNTKNYVKFMEENQPYWNLTKSRIISYWNEYYRKEHKNLKNYIGYMIVEKIENYTTYNKSLEKETR